MEVRLISVLAKNIGYNDGLTTIQAEHHVPLQNPSTQFIDKLMEDNPEMEAQRLENRHLLWDVTLNPTEQAEFEAAKVNKKTLYLLSRLIPYRHDDQHAQYRSGITTLPQQHRSNRTSRFDRIARAYPITSFGERWLSPRAGSNVGVVGQIIECPKVFGSWRLYRLQQHRHGACPPEDGKITACDINVTFTDIAAKHGRRQA